MKAKEEEIQQLQEERKKTKTLTLFKDNKIMNLFEKLKIKISTASVREAKPSNRKIQIFVKIMMKEGNMLVISLHTNDTVRKLKQLIQQKKGIPPDAQSLYITGTGKRLLDEQELTISDFGIQNGTTIELRYHIAKQTQPNN